MEIQEYFFAEEYKLFLQGVETFLAEKKKAFYNIFKSVLLYQLTVLIENLEFGGNKSDLIEIIESFNLKKLTNNNIDKVNGGTRKAKIE